MLNKIGIWVTLAALVALLLWVDNKVANAANPFYKVQAGDTLFVNGYCDNGDAAFDLYEQLAWRSPNIPLKVPATCYPEKKGVVVEKVLDQSPSVRTSRSEVVMVMAVGEEDRWYIGFSNNVQKIMNKGILFTPAVQIARASDTKWMAGETVILGAYCNSTDEQLVRDMSDAVLRGGWNGYINWISGNNPCYDARIPSHYVMGIRSIQGTLLEKLWTVKTEDETLEIWRFVDLYRQMGFTWLKPKIVPERDA